MSDNMKIKSLNPNVTFLIECKSYHLRAFLQKTFPHEICQKIIKTLNKDVFRLVIKRFTIKEYQSIIKRFLNRIKTLIF
jgi:hypothetical protein